MKRDRAVIATRFHRPQTSLRRVREMTQMCEAVMDGVRPVNVLCGVRHVQRAACSAWRAARSALHTAACCFVSPTFALVIFDFRHFQLKQNEKKIIFFLHIVLTDKTNKNDNSFVHSFD